MKIPVPNAFTINRLGVAPFPFGFSRKHDDEGPHVLYVFPVRLLDVSDIIEAHAQPNLLLFNVSHNFPDRNTGGIRPLDAIAKDRGVDCTACDKGTIKIRKADLGTLLTRLPHYDMKLIDLAESADEDTVLHGYVAASGNRRRGSPTLPKLQGPRLFVDIHDDCYLHLESWHEELLKDVLARNLQIYVGTVGHKETERQPDIRVPPVPLVNEIWSRFPSLTSLRQFARLDGNKVHVGLSGIEFSHREDRAYPLAGEICYDLGSRQWQITGYS